MCVACREMKNKKELIRIVDSSKENKFLVDPTGKHSGRGAYICNNIDCFQKAVKIKALDKAFEKSIDQDVIETLKSYFQPELNHDG